MIESAQPGRVARERPLSFPPLALDSPAGHARRDRRPGYRHAEPVAGVGR